MTTLVAYQKFESSTCADAQPEFNGLFDFSIAPNLLFYTYIPLLFLLFFLIKKLLENGKKDARVYALVGLSLSFSGWICMTLLAWIAAPITVVYFSWQIIYLFEVLVYGFATYLAYVFFHQHDMPNRLKITLFLLYAPILVITPTQYLIHYFNYAACEGVQGSLFWYVYFVEVVSIGIVGTFLMRAFFRRKVFTEQDQQEETRLVNAGVFILISIFLFFNFLSFFLKDWKYEMFGVVGVFLFIILLGYSIIRYKTFNIQLAGVELLVGSMGFLIFSLLFVRKIASVKVVVCITLALFAIIAYALLRSVKKEIATRRKGEQLARYLANANARLRELDKQKTDFVSVASHQLRSPIAAIKGYASMVTEGSFGEVPEQMKEPLSRILESGKRIALMVDDFLNVTRIEQGRMTYSMEKQNLCDLVGGAVEELHSLGEKKGLAFNVDSGALTAHPIWIEADAGKLRQVFSNIVDNAIKYTVAGSISVSIQELENHKTVLVKVTDTGIGIPAEEQEKLFHKFNRASNANTASVYGTGLGLYIAKEIVKAHKGWIHITSEGIGKGTVFTIELPLFQEGAQKEESTTTEE